MSKILGISAFYHDSAASLVIDGKIVGAVQEERFTRLKHDASFPVNSIKHLLISNNLDLNEIDKIIFYEKPFLKFERLLETYLGFAPKGFLQFCVSIPLWLKEKLFQKNLIINFLKSIDINFNSKNKILFSEHHLSHAASAFYPSPFEKALVITADGVGEWATTTIAIGDKNNLEIKEEIMFPHSLGLLYSSFTYYTGFKVNSGEYKLMGLAPYGSPIYQDIIKKELIDIKDDGSFRLNQKYFDYATGFKMTNKNFDKLFGKSPRDPNKEKINQFHMDLASSIQKITEEIILKIVKYAKKKYMINKLCLAGGVALNCVANGKIVKEKIFENIWIQPASGDAGGSLGGALYYWFAEKKNIRNIGKFDTMNGSHLGPQFSNSEIKKSLTTLRANYNFFKDDDLIEKISDDLSNQKIIGWFQGRMEFGPRALGARSIIADPRDKNMQKKMNLKIKFRESFRPFAPSILKENIKDFFDLKLDSPYMLITSDIKENKRLGENELKNIEGFDKLKIKKSDLPAVTHVDYSARIQTIDEIRNPKFFNLIKFFKKKTNCPAIINTSFNIRGEPIVCTPEDAFRCFMNTEMDILVLENYVLEKKNQELIKHKNYKEKYLND